MEIMMTNGEGKPSSATPQKDIDPNAPLDMFDAPIPGESLTTDPESKMPFEKPPAFTDEKEAMEALFLRVTDEEVLDDILDLMREEMPVEDIAQVILFEGFRTGQYNPDLMLLMIEPTIYMLLMLANYAQIDAVLYPEEDFDEEDEEGGEKALSSINDIIERRGEAQTASVSVEEDMTVVAGGKEMERPESVSTSFLDTIKERVSTEGE